jgi:regulatory protein YycH of two-component signal transduction system YycFG
LGLKYIEPVKSIVLILLVVLSILLTFSIWTYSPRYEVSEPSPPVDVSIAEKKKVIEIIKPYKTVFNFDDTLRGTTDQTDIDGIVDEMLEWKISNIALVNNNFLAEDLSKLLRKKNRFTLYFHGEVPLTVYDDVLKVDETNVPEILFDRIVVDWNPANSEMDIYFVSRANKMLYSAKAKAEDLRSFNQSILPKARELAAYRDVNPKSSSFIAVPTGPVETIRYTYIEDENSPNQFRDALFSDPNAVWRSPVGSNKEELGDDHALMSVDLERKTLKYFRRATESRELAIPSELLLNTINYVNEHEGWTDEFRYTFIDPESRTVKFRLFLNGLPVYTDSSSSTEIVQRWGKDQILSYKRPYYTLKNPIVVANELLPPGIDIAERLSKLDTLNFDAVEEIAPGYFMKHDLEKGIFILEPTWFYLLKGNWNRFSPESLGGELIGLE